MSKIEIGAGFVVTAFSGFGLLQFLPAGIILLVIGLVLICHGSFEEWLKPQLFLEQYLEKWLKNRHYNVKTENRPDFYYIIMAKDEFHREVVISRDKKDKNVLAFTGIVRVGESDLQRLLKLNETQQKDLIENIRLYFTSKNMGYWDASWPPNQVKIQTALAIDNHISEHAVDLKAKEIINSILGIRSLFRRALIQVE